MLIVAQVSVIFTLIFLFTEGKKPPGYVEMPKEHDPNPPNYKYGFRIEGIKGIQGRDEKREGIFAEGRYYIQNPDSSHNVRYFTDNWGYHPIVEYSNTGPHSRSSASFIPDEEALKYKKSGFQKIPEKEELDGKKNQSPTELPPSQEDPGSKKSETAPLKESPSQPMDDGEHLKSMSIPPSPEPSQIGPAPENQICCFSQPDSNKICCFSQKSVTETPQLQHKQPLFVLLLQSSPKILNLLQDEYLPRAESPSNSVDKDQKSIDRSFNSQNFKNMLDATAAPNFGKLIESTKDMVTGMDVLDINKALDQKDQEPSVTTASVTEKLLSKPIVAAESSEPKPVTENNQEQDPRPASTQFLAPITAGIQLQQAEQTTEEAKKMEEVRMGDVMVQVQKSLPYYLGKFEYPMEHVAEGKNNEMKTPEVTASENMELGKTLLYFPVEGWAKAEKLIKEMPSGDSNKTYPSEDMKIMNQSNSKPATQVVEKVVEKPVHIPVEVTKYIDRPYPVKPLAFDGPKTNGYLPPSNNGYLPPRDCDGKHKSGYKNQFSLKNPDGDIGLMAPKYNLNYRQNNRNYRNARSNFNEKTIKMEYGFMPPLIPSLEIDEQGQPIEKHDNRK